MTPGTLPIHLYARRPDYGVGPYRSMPRVGLQPAAIPLGPLGTLGVDPSLIIFLDPVLLGPPGSTGVTTIAIRGQVHLTVYLQALLEQPNGTFRLTNAGRVDLR